MKFFSLALESVYTCWLNPADDWGNFSTYFLVFRPRLGVFPSHQNTADATHCPKRLIQPWLSRGKRLTLPCRASDTYWPRTSNKLTKSEAKLGTTHTLHWAIFILFTGNLFISSDSWRTFASDLPHSFTGQNCRNRPSTWTKGISKLDKDLLLVHLSSSRGFPGGSEVKASASDAGDPGSIPGSGRSLGEGNGNPLQYSCLENPMDGEA